VTATQSSPAAPLITSAPAASGPPRRPRKWALSAAATAAATAETVHIWERTTGRGLGTPSGWGEWSAGGSQSAWGAPLSWGEGPVIRGETPSAGGGQAAQGGQRLADALARTIPAAVGVR